MNRTQKNKATMKHLCLLRAKLAKLKREQLDAATGKGSGGGGAAGFAVSKSGVARIGMIGFPSVGKSTLLCKLTGTFSEVAAYEFTTLTAIPGVLMYKGTKLQLLDLPGIIEGAKDGKGRGKQVIGTARTCDLILMVLDALKPWTHKMIIEYELEGFGIRLNREPPRILVKKRERGGVSVISTVKQSVLDQELVKTIVGEYRMPSVEVTLHCDASEEDLIDVLEGNRVYIPCLYVLNKIDALTLEELEIMDPTPHYVCVSADKEWNFDELLERAWDH